MLYNTNIFLVKGGEHRMTSFDLIWLLIQELLKSKNENNQENNKKD